MARSQSTYNRAYLVEKFVDLAASSGTTEGIEVGAGTLVLAAGFEPSEDVPDVTTYTLDVTDGTTVFANDLDFDDAAAGTILVGTTAGLVVADDTIDVVTTISGSPGVISGRVFAVVVDVNNQVAQNADEVDRDQLA
jgi:hypothetical protein